MAEHQPVEVRITHAVRDIERKDSERRRRKAGLQATLARLEDRFNARHAELEDMRARSRSLDDANREIEAYIMRLADLVEHAATGAAEASAALTLQLRTEMLPVAERFEDVSLDELEAEDAPDTAWAGEPGDIDIPSASRGGQH